MTQNPAAQKQSFIRNAWYVCATRDELAAGSVARRVLNTPLFLYNNAEGKPIAMLDRCPHRRFPMSQGILEEGGVRCGYHGLKFNDEGRCIDIPAQSRQDNKICIRTFEAIEYADWIWVWMGDEPSAGRLPPQPKEFVGGGNWRRQQIVAKHVKARASLFHDNLLDLSHLSYLHASNIGGSGVAETHPQMQITEYGLNVHRQMLDPVMESLPLGKAMEISGPVVRVMDAQFYLPNLHITGSAFFAPDAEGNPAGEIGSFRVLHALTPETETTTHYFQAYQRNFRQQDPACDAMLSAVLNLPIPEDVTAAELIEADLSSGDVMAPEVHITSDVVGLRGRLLLERMLEAERAGDGAGSAPAAVEPVDGQG